MPPTRDASFQPSYQGPGPARCINCYYVIENLHEQRCPECGEPFIRDDPSTFTTDPPAMVYWHWGLALLVALAVAVATSGWLLASGNWLGALGIGVPMAASVMIGYALRPGVRAGLAVLTLLALTMLAIFIAQGIHGLLFALLLAVMIGAPLLAGCCIGIALHRALSNSARARSRDLLMLIALLIPLTYCV